MVAQNGRTPLWGVDQDWNEVHIPIIGVTGPFTSGKSLFMGTIAPGNKRTRYYDAELSAKQYAGGLQLDYVDMQATMRVAFGNQTFRPVDMFRWWRNDVLSVEPGKYDVIATDPASDLESGLASWVASRYADFGFSTEAKFVMTGGIYWNLVRESWKALLADIASRCQTFVFSTHTRVKWVGGKPTSQSEAKGKSTLMELASLYLWLDRSPGPDGTVPKAPRCTRLMKNRVTFTRYIPGEGVVIQPYLPPAFDNCTPDTIRAYIKKPVDLGNLAAHERVTMTYQTEEERQAIELEIATANMERERLANERLARQQELLAAQNATVATEPQATAKATATVQPSATPPAVVAVGGAAPGATATATFSASAAAPNVTEPAQMGDAYEPPVGQQSAVSMLEKVDGGDDVPFDVPAEATLGHVPRPGYCNANQVGVMVDLKKRLNVSMDNWNKGIVKRTGGSTNPLDLTEAQANEIITNLRTHAEKMGV